MSDNYLTIWVIYDHPADHPYDFVVRPSYVYPGRVAFGPAKMSGTLEGARDLLPEGLYRMDRDPDDDPVIVETWL